MQKKKFDDTLFVNRDLPIRGFKHIVSAETQPAAMLIRAPSGMGKSWLLDMIQHVCENELAVTPLVIKIDFAYTRDIQHYLGFIRTFRDRFDTLDPFQPLIQLINRFVDTSSGSAFKQLVEQIMQSFNERELQQFVQTELDMMWGEIGGDTLVDRAFELVDFFERRGVLTDLIDKLTAARSKLVWEYGSQLPAFDTIDERDRVIGLIDKAFLAGLEVVLKQNKSIVVLFDSYNQAPQEIESWIRTVFLPWLRRDEAKGMTVIMSWVDSADPDDKANELPNFNLGGLLVPPLKLDGLKEEHIKEYLFERLRLDIPPDHMPYILAQGRTPQMLALLASPYEPTIQEESTGSFWDTV